MYNVTLTSNHSPLETESFDLLEQANDFAMNWIRLDRNHGAQITQGEPVPDWAAAPYAFGYSIDTIMSWDNDTCPTLNELYIIRREINDTYELDNPANESSSAWDVYWHITHVIQAREEQIAELTGLPF